MSSEKIYKVTIEGQTLELPAEIAAEDKTLKEALQTVFPGASNAKFMRTEKDGVVTVNVIKQAGTKGTGACHAPLQYLDAATETRNPVIDLQNELRDLDVRRMSTDEMLELDERVQQVIAEGQEQNSRLEKALARLHHARPTSASQTPEGF
jgi:hypothetical protein